MEVTQRFSIGKFATNDFGERVARKVATRAYLTQATAKSRHGFEAADRSPKTIIASLSRDSDNGEVAVAARDLPKGGPAVSATRLGSQSP